MDPHNRLGQRAARLEGSSPTSTASLCLLQGGGALGSYPGRRLSGSGRGRSAPAWVAGVSIGAINAALIAGNPPQRRVERLREFWTVVSESPIGLPNSRPGIFRTSLPISSSISSVPSTRCCGERRASSSRAFPPPILMPVGSPAQLSFYDVSPLRTLLGRLVDSTG
jgi:NTE family protein